MARKFENLINDKRNGNQYAYLLDAFYNPETGEAFASDAEAVRYMWEQFNDEYNCEYNRRRYPNLSQRVGAWLQGLGGSISIAFADFDIIEQGKAWGYCRNDYEARRFVADWWNVCGYRCVQLWQALGLC